MKSILSNDMTEPSRPVSNDEIKYIVTQFLEDNKLAIENWVWHRQCNHIYLVKTGSKKYESIKENSDDRDIGNCSVCWKLGHTPSDITDRAYWIVNAYCHEFTALPNNQPIAWTYFNAQIQKIFYTWLYREQYVGDRIYKQPRRQFNFTPRDTPRDTQRNPRHIPRKIDEQDGFSVLAVDV